MFDSFKLFFSEVKRILYTWNIFYKSEKLIYFLNKELNLETEDWIIFPDWCSVLAGRTGSPVLPLTTCLSPPHHTLKENRITTSEPASHMSRGGTERHHEMTGESYWTDNAILPPLQTVRMTVFTVITRHIMLLLLGLSSAVLAKGDKNSTSVSDPLQRVMLEFHLYQVEREPQSPVSRVLTRLLL